MDYGIYAGDTNKTIYFRLRDSSTGLAKTGLVYNSAGAVASYTLPGAARAAITLATQTVTGAHSDGGFVEVDATNCKGLYRLDLPDAAIASGDYTIISIEFDGIIEESQFIPLHTAQQTGDSFARLGAPAGASVSADIAAVASAVDAVDNFIDTEIAAIIATLGTPANGSVSDDIAGVANTLGTGGQGLSYITDILGSPTDLGGGANLAANNVDMAGATFLTSTDSLEAIRNWIGDGTNLTEAGGTGDQFTAFTSSISIIRNSVVATTGTIQDASATTTTFNTDLTQVDGYWDDALLQISSGALDYQTRPILSYSNTNGQIVLDEPLTDAPANGVSFRVLVAHIHPISQIADGVLDRDASSHTTNSTLGAIINDWENGGRLDLILDELTAQGDTNETKLDTIDNFIDTEIAAIIAAIGTPSDLGSGATLAANLADIEGQTDDIGTAGAGLTALATAAELAKVPKSDGSASWNATALAAIQAEAVDALQETIPDTVPTAGNRPNTQQAVRMALQALTDFEHTGLFYDVYKEDGTTLLMRMTRDDATNPTLAHRTT